MRTLPIAALLVLLAACGGEPDAPAPAEERTGQPADREAEPAAGWTLGEAGGAPALLWGEEGSVEARLACADEPPRITLWVAGFERIGSEERLSLGLDGEPVTMVAEIVGAEGPGVSAATVLTAELADALRQADAVSALYGNQRFGPVPMPDPAALDTLLAGCAAAE